MPLPVGCGIPDNVPVGPPLPVPVGFGLPVPGNEIAPVPVDLIGVTVGTLTEPVPVGLFVRLVSVAVLVGVGREDLVVEPTGPRPGMLRG